MTESELKELNRKIELGIRTAIAEALDVHRRLGQTIAVWQDGKIVLLTGDEIKPQWPDELLNCSTSAAHTSQEHETAKIDE